MNRTRILTTFWTVLVTCVAMGPAARAHFLWVRVEPGGEAGQSTVRAFFNEDPTPDAKFTRFVRDVRLTIDGQPVPSRVGDGGRVGRWAGSPPAWVDSELDFGVTTRGPSTFRLVYTARVQTGPISSETAGRLRVRLIGGEAPDRVEVCFDGKPAARARIKVYPAEGDPFEQTADEKGRADVVGLSQGKAALWASKVDPTPGTHDGKAYSETRHYATLTCAPSADTAATATGTTAFATMPAPAVTSLGAAVLGRWLYVYGGHVGRMHRYDVSTTSRHFRRLNLDDGKSWEDLPSGPDLQGLTLVSDGKALYRVGGMAARNRPDEEQDMHSVADVASFDPESKRWTDLPPMPEPRSTHDAAVLGRTLYVVGGWTMKGASEESHFLDHALALDLDRPSAGWRSIPQPFRRRALAVASHAGKLYVLGGLAGGGMKVERRVDVYDPEKSTWGRGPDVPSGARAEGFGSSAFELDGRLYLSGATGRIWRLNGSGDAWEAVGAWSVPRITHRLLAAPGHTLLAVGGSAKGQPTASIEAVRPRAIEVRETSGE